MVADSARDAVGNAAGLEWTPAGARRLKGVSGEVKLYRVNRVSV
jgi:adenylate cyclase